MKMGYTPFVAENIAPPNATHLVVFDGDTEVGTVSIEKLKPTNLGAPLYSFGLVSDLHIGGYAENASYLSEAFTFFENLGCSFACHCGDITNRGFWTSSESTTIDTAQMAEFKAVVDAHPNLPVYGICGNHESYYKPITQNLAELKTYTGIELCYTYPRGNDLFVFLSQPAGTAEANTDDWVEVLDWLQTTLDNNADKRCFVFEHLTLSCDSGNPDNIHNAFWGDLENALVSILKQHANHIVLFHGHSHLDPNEQLKPRFTRVNLSTYKGFYSVHVPSSCGNRVTINGTFDDKTSYSYLRAGYVVDVYQNHVVLRGYNFHSKKPIPIAQYCIALNS